MLRDDLQIERTALELRKQLGFESYGVCDVFSAAEKLGLVLIRYPFGRNTICGFSTVFEGKKVVVSNSSEILSREIFTIAHEIGHCHFDLDVDEQRLIVDKEINSNSGDYIEERADYFAAVFLLPEEELRKYAKYELEKDFKEIRTLDVIRMQVDFNVSFAAIVTRLYALNLIDYQLKTRLFDERDRVTSKKLFLAMHLKDDLIKPAKVLKVPNRYYEYVISNYEKGYISFEKLNEALQLVGFEAKDLVRIDDEEDDSCLDDLIEGY